MKTGFVLTVAATLALTAPAFAQDYPPPAPSHSYYGNDGSYHHHCKRSSGTTGTVLGAVGGGLAGNALGGGTLGTLAGAGGGALLGRHLDKKHDAAQNRRNGC